MDIPNPRLQALLEGPAFFHSYEHHGDVTSTNDLAAARLAEGTPPGLVVVADHQTAGRGRAGRAWQDHTGQSLLVSVTVPPPPTATLAPLATGLAVSDAITRHKVDAVLKWPNDVLVGERKCAGILVEQHRVGSSQTPVLVVGMGINVDWRGVGRDGEAAGWTSVAEEAGEEIDRFDLLTDLLRALEAWFGDATRSPGRLLTAYRTRCVTLGQRVRVVTGDDEAAGLARDVDRTGALVLETDRGVALVSSGDVVHVRRQD